jgi:hypothetical protein
VNDIEVAPGTMVFSFRNFSSESVEGDRELFPGDFVNFLRGEAVVVSR